MSEEDGTSEKPRKTLSIGGNKAEVERRIAENKANRYGQRDAEESAPREELVSSGPRHAERPTNRVSRSDIPFIDRHSPEVYINKLYAKRIRARTKIAPKKEGHSLHEWDWEYNNALGQFMHDIDDVIVPSVTKADEPIRIQVTIDSPENMRELYKALGKRDLLTEDKNEETGETLPGFLDEEADPEVQELVDNYMQSEVEDSLEIPICITDSDQLLQTLIHLQPRQQRDALEMFSSKVTHDKSNAPLTQRQMINILFAAAAIQDCKVERSLMDDEAERLLAEGGDAAWLGTELVRYEQAQREQEPDGAFRHLPNAFALDFEAELNEIYFTLGELEQENIPSGTAHSRA